MNKKEIDFKSDLLEKNTSLINQETEDMAYIQETLIAFMKANNLKQLNVDGMIITLDEGGSED